MLILPLPRAPNWRRPPVVTLFIIIVCTAIYFVAQGRDTQLQTEAWRFYFASELADVELPLYRNWLNQRGQDVPAEPDEPRARMVAQVQLAQAMMEEAAFMRELRHGPLRPQSADWADKRARFDALLQAPVSTRYGFSPANPAPATWVTHMFLHGSESHLLGNMVVLFIAGYMVEEVVGGLVFLLLYLLAGIGACAFDFALHAGRVGVGIGASGAISGIMALYVGLFRLQRVRFFYWILFYADFFRAPALVILPLWVLNEAWQMWSNPGSHINYAAHIGGFLSGALLAGAWLLISRRRVEASVTEATLHDPVQGELDAVAGLIAALRLEPALQRLGALLDRHPQDARVARYYFNVARTQPGAAHLHKAAGVLLQQRDPTGELTRDVVREYLKLAGPAPQLAPDLLASTARRLLRGGFAAEGEPLLRALYAAAPRHPLVPELLLLQARLLQRQGDHDRLQATLARLRDDFPDSEEARLSRHWS